MNLLLYTGIPKNIVKVTRILRNSSLGKQGTGATCAFFRLLESAPNPLQNAACGSGLRIRLDAYDGGCATKKAAAREQQLQNGITLFSPTVKSVKSNNT